MRRAGGRRRRRGRRRTARRGGRRRRCCAAARRAGRARRSGRPRRRPGRRSGRSGSRRIDRARVHVEVLGHPVVSSCAERARASRGTRSRARRRGTRWASSRSGTVKPMWSTPAQARQSPSTLLFWIRNGLKPAMHAQRVASSTASTLDFGSNPWQRATSTDGGDRHARAPPARARRRRGSSSSPPTTTGTPPTPQLLAHDATRQLVLIRAFEEYVLDLAGAGLIHGPAHSSIGQEGGAVGSVLALTSEDSVNGSHRGHHQFLAKALHHVEPKGIDPLAPLVRRRARGAAAHARRDLRPRPRLEPRPRRVDAPAVEGGRRDGHQRHRRRRRPAGGRLRLGRTSRPAPTRSRSPTSATARSTSARPSRR